MKKWLYWIFPLSWMGVIFYSSAQPYQKQDIKPFLSDNIDLSFLEPLIQTIVFSYHQQEVSVANLGINGFVEFFVRKGAHVTVFLLLFLLFYLAIIKTTNLSVGKTIGTAFFASVLYASFDEIHQGFTPNRTPYIGDVILDSVGAILGIGLLLIGIACYKRSKPRKEAR
ncbi:VanZ family protein [Aquibacillus kalidii]|uniref:VanZ family protein n=1 Tax=Aquibacillus kalidii TaxID=2762597 RepID=UPI0016454D51|nr:VanZ family protein [Aquibacillus kalidii]